jgi:hypothetical protein
MNDKHIKEEDYKKAFNNVFPLVFNPRKCKEEFKGCLFIYDDKFCSSFDNLECFLKEWNDKEWNK